MKKDKTKMKVVCAWCGADMGTKDGQGVKGTSHGICPECFKKELAKLPKKTPARWNLVGRILARRRARQKTSPMEATDQEKELANIQDMFAANPALHAQVILRGRHMVHYLKPEDLFALTERVADEPEIKCRWN